MAIMGGDMAKTVVQIELWDEEEALSSDDLVILLEEVLEIGLPDGVRYLLIEADED